MVTEKDCLKEIREIDEAFDSEFAMRETDLDNKFRELFESVMCLDFRILLEAQNTADKINSLDECYRSCKHYKEYNPEYSWYFGYCSSESCYVEKLWPWNVYRIIHAYIAVKKLLIFLNNAVVVETEEKAKTNRLSNQHELSEYKMQCPSLDAVLSITYNAITPHLTGFHKWLIDEGAYLELKEKGLCK